MLLSFKNISHFEGSEFLGAVRNFFNFEADAHKPIKDFLQRSGGVEMLFEPGESEFHKCVPNRPRPLAGEERGPRNEVEWDR